MILQRTPEWYTARLGKFTASCFHELISRPQDRKSEWSKSAMKSIERAALQIFDGRYIYSPDNEATRWGMDNEPFAIQAFSEATGFATIDKGFLLHPEMPDVGATPDAMVLCPETGQYFPLQVKCHFNRYSHADYLVRMRSGADLQKMKSQYYCQVQGEIWVTGAAYGWFGSYDPRMDEGSKIHYIKVERNEDFIAMLEDKVLKAIQLRDEMIEDFRQGIKKVGSLSTYR
jgi:hypothetical protein